MAKTHKTDTRKPYSPISVGILGASGYTGAELLRLLNNHDEVEISFITADRHAGKPISAVFPHLSLLTLPKLIPIDEAEVAEADLIFCALPHGKTQRVISSFLDKYPQKRIIDLSADFRLKDVDVYAQWYGQCHQAPDLQEEAVYGLSEIYRNSIRTARLCANPGCYTTTVELPLIPLLEEGLIAADDIIIDAKSGVSGAGRSEKQANLHTEVSEGTHAYGIGAHRHAPEIDQELSRAANCPVVVSFTPHLIPMNRGILATTYVRLKGKTSCEDLRACLASRYETDVFINVLQSGSPSTRDVRGTNQCQMSVCNDRLQGRAIIVSATDNLVKGASGQAIQNMNIMCGFPETSGLEYIPFFP